MRAVEVILFMCLCLIEAQVDYGLENDDCFLSTKERGKCVNIHDCAYAKGLLEDNQDPGFCGFKGRDPLVCCIEVAPVVSRLPGALSAQKCQEYYPYKKYFILVTGGEKSLAKEFPHMAIVGFGDSNDIQWSCGGSLISHKFILTAAHCLTSPEFGNARFVRLGDLDLSIDTDDASPQNFYVKKLIQHPEYKRPSRYHDIGLIELDRDVKLTEYVAIACLDTHREHEEAQMTVTGWGRTEFSGAFSSFLLKSDFDIVPHNVCKPFYYADASFLEFGIIDDYQICAGGTKEKDTCQGDSGGPLQVINGERSSSIRVYDVVGITSFGKACGLSITPGVYTRVYNYLSWIESVVWPFA